MRRDRIGVRGAAISAQPVDVSPAAEDRIRAVAFGKDALGLDAPAGRGGAIHGICKISPAPVLGPLCLAGMSMLPCGIGGCGCVDFTVQLRQNYG